MNRADVAALLEEFRPWIGVRQTLHGFELGSNFRRWRHRLQHGGGISGTNRMWWIEDLEQCSRTEIVTTKAGLRRIVREYLAEQFDRCKPPVREHNGVRFVPYATFAETAHWCGYLWRYRRVQPGT